MPRKEKVVKEVTVVPKVSGELEFKPATYSFQLSQDPQAARHKGVTTNKPKSVEIMTKREFILAQHWHFVSSE